MRQFVLSRVPSGDEELVLGAKDFKYLVQVLRMEVGELIDARLPDGSLIRMMIVAISRPDRTVSLVKVQPSATEPASAETAVVVGESMPATASLAPDFPHLVLFQWILKGPKMDQVIRQATEAGVEAIVPVAVERCLSRDAETVGDGKTGRWDRIVREALQQCGSPVSTRVLSPVSVPAIGSLWKSLSRGAKPLGLVLTEAPLARKSLHEYLDSAEGTTGIAVGPEGGMTPRELESLVASGFVCIHFKTNILRAETAALYGVAAVQAAITESEKWQLKE
jgi:16S rRNA (uracil1498-N3)-methyltransferase